MPTLCRMNTCYRLRTDRIRVPHLWQRHDHNRRNMTR
jgi:hypothetical protein